MSSDYIPNTLDTSVGRLFNLYQWETPTRLFVYKEVRKRAVEQNIASVVATVDRAIAHDRWLRNLENEWVSSPRRATWGPKMKSVDRDTMNALTDLSNMMMQVWRKAPEDSALRAELERLKTKMFPGGLASIIKASYVGKLAQLELIYETLRKNAWLRQHRLDVEIDDYNAHFITYRDTLETRKWGMSFKAIKAGRQEGHRYLCSLTAHIVGSFLAPDGADAKTRDFLLIPILDQNESMRKMLKERMRKRGPNHDPARTAEATAD